MRATRNMLAWWPGEGTWTDVVGGRTLTPENGALNDNAGIYGRGFNLEVVGDDRRMAATSSRVPVTGDYWACMFVNFAALAGAGGFNYVMTQGNPTGTTDREFELYYRQASNDLTVAVWNTSLAGFRADSGITPSLDTWYHLGLQVVSGTSTFQSWVNGRLGGTNTYTGTLATAASELRLGGISTGDGLTRHGQCRVKNPMVGLGILGARNWARLASNMHPLEAT